MKNKERRAKLDKLEEAIDEELSYDTYEDYPDENGRSRAQNSEPSQRKRASSLYLNKLL